MLPILVMLDVRYSLTPVLSGFVILPNEGVDCAEVQQIAEKASKTALTETDPTAYSVMEEVRKALVGKASVKEHTVISIKTEKFS